MSPVMSTIGEMKNGGALIRSMALDDFFARRQSAHVESWASVSYYTRALQTWAQHVGSTLAFFLGAATAFYIVVSLTRPPPL